MNWLPAFHLPPRRVRAGTHPPSSSGLERQPSSKTSEPMESSVWFSPPSVWFSLGVTFGNCFQVFFLSFCSPGSRIAASLADQKEKCYAS